MKYFKQKVKVNVNDYNTATHFYYIFVTFFTSKKLELPTALINKAKSRDLCVCKILSLFVFIMSAPFVHKKKTPLGIHRCKQSVI